MWSPMHKLGSINTLAQAHSAVLIRASDLDSIPGQASDFVKSSFIEFNWLDENYDKNPVTFLSQPLKGLVLVLFYSFYEKHSTNCLVQMIINPFCFSSVIKCPAVTPPANGLVGACSLNYQGTCSVSCADGYVRHGGDETRTCLVNKRWSGVPPTCRGTYP